MKLKKISVFFLVIPFIIFSQEKISGKIIYKYRIPKQVFDIKEKKESVKAVFNTYNKYIENSKSKISYELIFNNNNSYYKLIKILSIDKENDLEFAILFTGGKEEVYIDKNKNLKIKKIDVFGDFFFVKNTFKENWKLTQETKMISNYTCYKAILEKKIKLQDNKEKTFLIEAWFTPQVPVNFGPKGYGGLPGLILELHQGGIIYYAKKIELKKNKTVTIDMPIKGKVISEKEFSNMFRKFDKNRSKKR